MTENGTRFEDGNDTIAAVSTAPGLGAVAIVRVSGPESWLIVRKLLPCPEYFDRLDLRKSGALSLVHPRTKQPLDRAVIVKYRSPESFTGEDTVEVQCHGGVAVPSAVLEAIITAGARQAREGEFTRRAYLNGKLDLAQAEAVDDLVHARSEQGRLLALSGLSGALGKEAAALRERLTDLLAELEYDIDFPDEEPLGETGRRVTVRLGEIRVSLATLLENSKRNLLISRGALVVIAGAPNSGKSSLFNALAGQERSIVTPAAGTTRDAVEVEVMLGGVLLRLVDTAGLRKGRGTVERIGIEYSRRYLERADLVIFLHETGKRVSAPEKEFLGERDSRSVIRVLSKCDLRVNDSGVPDDFLPVSAKTGEGLDLLAGELRGRVLSGDSGDQSFGGPQITRLRQRELVLEALESLKAVEVAAGSEFIAEDIRAVCECLDELTGRVSDEDVLERIFSRFCIGK